MVALVTNMEEPGGEMPGKRKVVKCLNISSPSSLHAENGNVPWGKDVGVWPSGALR